MKDFDILDDGSQPELDSVCCKTYMWSRLSWTVCSRVSCIWAHVLELASVVHFWESRNVILSICVANLFFSDMLSLEYPVTSQIWISGRYDGWNFSRIYDLGSDKVDVLAGTPSRKIYYCSILIEQFDHPLYEDSMWLILEAVPCGSFVFSKFDLYLMF
jgi:hypothetical protein